MQREENLIVQGALGQMKQFPKAAANPKSRLRQARKRWKC